MTRVASPLASDCRAIAAVRTHVAAEKAEKEKERKYRNAGVADVTPAVLETTGAVGQRLQGWLNTRAGAIARRTGQIRSEVLASIKQGLSVCLQRGNAMVLSAAMMPNAPVPVKFTRYLGAWLARA